MLNSRRFRLLGAVFGGFLGAAAAMEYEPFPNCTDAAQVDSSRKLVYKDASMDPDLAPYTGYRRYKYFPGTCYPLQTVYQLYYLSNQVYRIDYRQGSATGVYDFVWTMTELDSSTLSGTAYFSPLGEMDSVKSWHIRPAESGGVDTDFVMSKSIRTPQYQLLRTYKWSVNSSLEFTWGDSIVMTTRGEMIYSVDGEDTAVTRCSSVGPTHVCEESPSMSGFRPRKSIWFLTQGRKDSLQTWEDGELISTEKYFWSARTAGIRSPRVRTSGPTANSVWNEFDIMGRTRLDWTNSDKSRSDRNKAWPRTQF